VIIFNAISSKLAVNPAKIEAVTSKAIFDRLLDALLLTKV